MLLRKRILLSVVALCVAFGRLAPQDAPANAESDELPHIAITGFANQTGDESFGTPAATATDSLTLTLRMLGAYRIVAADGVPAAPTDAALAEWCTAQSVDYLLYGSIAAQKGGTQSYSLSVFDRAKGKTTIKKATKGTSIFDVFSCADTLTFAVIDAIAGRHVGFGSIAFEVANPSASEGKAVVAIDGVKLAEGFGQIDRVVEGNHLVRVTWETQGTKPKEIALVEIAVAEGECATMAVTIPGTAKSTVTRKPRANETTDDSMVLVEGGTFTMGSDTGPANERPAHEVTVESFWMGKTEVTQESFEKLLGNLPHSQGNGSFDQKKNGSQYPVLLLNKFDAIKYCNALSVREGYQPAYSIRNGKVSWDRLADGYRLPTEAEWEYAAKGGANHDAFLYPGSDNVAEVAIVSKTANGNGYAIVATKMPNSLGIFDMGGNVYEWCWDQFKSYSGFNYSNYFMVIRGGDSLHGTKDARCTARAGDWEGWSDEIYSSRTNNNIGFRLVRSITQSEE